MPRHLWREVELDPLRIRVCEVCCTQQLAGVDAPWPAISPICPGDDDRDDGRPLRRGGPQRPAGGTRVRDLVEA
jgi:hypothetical protein